MRTKSAKEIRGEAWSSLGHNGQYWTFVAGTLILSILCTAVFVPILIMGGAGVAASGVMPYFQPGGHPEIGLFLDPAVMVPLLTTALLVSILIIYPIGFLCWGNAAMAIATMRRGLTFGHAFSGWGHGWKMGWIVMVRGTYVMLWSLLLWVPGIIKAISYAMTDFVAVDHPGWNANQCITESRRLMNGNKWRYFCLMLSFFGWVLLLVVACMIPVVGGVSRYFFAPYFESAKAAFYEDLLDRDGASSVAASAGEVADYAGAFDSGASGPGSVV